MDLKYYIEQLKDAPPLFLVLIFVLMAIYIILKFTTKSNKDEMRLLDKISENRTSLDSMNDLIQTIKTEVYILKDNVKVLSDITHRMSDKHDEKLEKIVISMSSMYNDLEDTLDVVKNIIKKDR